jgi:transcriptional regulator with XRE-family HTH domain
MGGAVMAKKLGTLIKEARTQAGMTQEALAKKVKGVSAHDISLAERGEKELTQAALKEIARATGVTQKSLLDAVKTAGSTKKTSTGSTKKTSTGSTKKSSGTAFQLKAEEKKLIQAYREADEKTQMAVRMLLLKSEGLSSASSLAAHTAGGLGDLLGSGDLISSLMGSVKDLLK